MNITFYGLSVWVLPLLIAITFHEAAHAFVAHRLGDKTAWELGRVSFNPIRHIDPFGTVMLPAMLLLSHSPFLFGYAKPVPVNFRALNNPRLGMVLVALAGPGMNLLLAVAAALAIAVLAAFNPTGEGWMFVGQNLVNFMAINVFLAVFNLIPLPPFDGGHVVEGLLPRNLAVHFRKLRRYSLLLLIILLVGVPMAFPSADIVQKTIGPPVDWIIRALLPNSVA